MIYEIYCGDFCCSSLQKRGEYFSSCLKDRNDGDIPSPDKFLSTPLGAHSKVLAGVAPSEKLLELPGF